jgi:ABC-type spermidine/putrescine transport system permease subunit II
VIRPQQPGASPRAQRPFLRRLREHPLLLVALLLQSALVLLPLVYMLSTSFKLPVEVFEVPMRWIPRELRIENYVEPLQQRPFVRWFINSTIVAVSVTILNLSRRSWRATASRSSPIRAATSCSASSWRPSSSRSRPSSCRCSSWCAISAGSTPTRA